MCHVPGYLEHRTACGVPRTRRAPRACAAGAGGTRPFLLLALVLAVWPLLSPTPLLAEPASPTARPLRMGYTAAVIDSVDLQDAKVALKAWTDITSKEDGTDFVSDANIYNDLQDLIRNLVAGELDLIGVAPLEYLEHCETLPILPTYTGVFGGQTTHPELLLVHKESGIEKLADLKDRPMVIENAGIGALPMVWLEVELARAGLPPAARYLGKIKTTQKGNQSVLPVFFKQTAACVVRENVFNNMVELNPQLGRDLKIIAKSAPFCKSIVSFRKDYSKENREILVKNAIKLHKSIKGKQILTLFRTEQIVVFDPNDLSSCRALFTEYQAIKKRPVK